MFLVRFIFIFLASLSFIQVFSQQKEARDWKLFPKTTTDSVEAAEVVLTKDETISIDTNYSTETNDSTWQTGVIEITTNQGIRELLDLHIALNDSIGKMRGYRIQLYFGSGPGSKTEANNIKVRFKRSFPDVIADVDYEYPNFTVKVGGFRTRLEAYKFLQEVRDSYPSSFIIRGMIELPTLVWPEENEN